MATTETEIQPDLAAKLPNELVEEILSAHVRSFDHNPSYQWIQLRHLSRRQRHLIETYFRKFWLPTVSITLYLGGHHQIDYKFSSVEWSGAGNLDTDSTNREESTFLAVFRADQSTVFHDRDTPNPFTPAALARLWREYLAETKPDCGRTASIRFGEGVLNGGLSGGYIFNVAELHGLQFDASDGSEIWFRFRETITSVMRDEFRLRQITLNLVSTASRDMLADWNGV
ncbi:hypothetical protein B0H66DRAFT_324954 [Apodospora peruviana]|uniref:Uncharacterized protein n=1 Tax=Apodospora peruviana TaxID=516989 RepID=A0AAE0M0S6_9PEZI|nr:hypothetical protein B0H66DRAFT_324954 [Apodospora peruviana]